MSIVFCLFLVFILLLLIFPEKQTHAYSLPVAISNLFIASFKDIRVVVSLFIFLRQNEKENKQNKNPIEVWIQGFLLSSTQQQAAAVWVFDLNSAWKVTQYRKLLIACTSKYSFKGWSYEHRCPGIHYNICLWKVTIVHQPSTTARCNCGSVYILVNGYTGTQCIHILGLNLMEILLSNFKSLIIHL